MSKNRLGKGLGALISSDNKKNDESVSEDMNNAIKNIYVKKIEPNPFQPRQEFDQQSLEELANSIEDKGVLQPVTVRQAKPDLYQLVTGERRWRACKLIGVNKIPAIVRDYSDDQMMEIALIENLQREDLNPIEKAQAYKTMLDQFNLTQEEVAKKVGKSRSSIANVVRLLNLAPKVQMFVSRETMSMGHARALLALDNNELQIKTAEHIIKNNLTVRETEKFLTELKNNKEKVEQKNQKQKEKEDKKLKTKENQKSKQKNANNQIDKKWLKAKEKFSTYLNTEVEIKNNKNKKVFSISFDNYEDVEKILSKLEK